MSNINIVASTSFWSFSREFYIEDETNDKTTNVTYNIFQRIGRFFAQLFCRDYFSGAFKVTTSPKDTNSKINNNNNENPKARSDKECYELASNLISDCGKGFKYSYEEVLEYSEYLKKIEPSGVNKIIDLDYQKAPPKIKNLNQKKLIHLCAFMLLRGDIYYFDATRIGVQISLCKEDHDIGVYKSDYSIGRYTIENLTKIDSLIKKHSINIEKSQKLSNESKVQKHINNFVKNFNSEVRSKAYSIMEDETNVIEIKEKSMKTNLHKSTAAILKNKGLIPNFQANNAGNQCIISITLEHES